MPSCSGSDACSFVAESRCRPPSCRPSCLARGSSLGCALGRFGALEAAFGRDSCLQSTFEGESRLAASADEVSYGDSRLAAGPSVAAAEGFASRAAESLPCTRSAAGRWRLGTAARVGERAARVFLALHGGRKRLLGLGGVGVLWLLVGEGEGCAGRDACKRGVQRLGVDLFEAWL